MSNEMIQIGTRELWGNQSSPVSLSVENSRQHCYIVGKTGSGKSTLLRNLIVQHIKLGHGIAIIDPHGDLAESILDAIPSWRADHVCYFNPGDLDFPVSFNVLANVPADQRSLVASGVVGAFKNIWPDSWGPRMEYIFLHAVAALTECPNATLLGVNQMLSDDTYRHWVIRQVTDPFVRDFWENEFENYDSRFRREIVAPITNKIGQLSHSPAIRNILGQVRSSISIPFIMDHRRIFIANLSKGQIGHDKSALIGSLLVSQFQIAGMSRSSRTEESRLDFHIFVDEFQNFVTEAFASMLSELRKYRLYLTLAHQFIDQIPLSIRSAIFGNVGTLIAFRVGYVDGKVLHYEFGEGLSPQQFVDLAQFEVFIRMHPEGRVIPCFRAKSNPSLKLCQSARSNLIALSRARFAAQREEVESKLKRWLQRTF